MKAKTYFQLSLLLCTAWLSIPLYSQVTIGDEAMPRKGAVLDLKKQTDLGYLGGLLLPNVALTSLDSIPTGFTDALSKEERDVNEGLTGLFVYNTNTATGTGLYFWNGYKWLPVISCTDAAITSTSATNIGVNLGQTTNLPTFSVSASGRPSLTYQWYKGEQNGETSLITGATGNTYTMLAGDVPTAAGSIQYWCKVSSEGCEGATSPAFTVRNCGAYVDNQGKWLNFMCHNLGANKDANPFIPSAAIHGERYQFGVKDAVLSQADDQSNSSSVSGWPSNSTTGNWDMNTANPCPSGWRVPTKTEWDGVLSNNTVYRTNNNGNTWVTGTQYAGWVADAANYSTGIKFGDALVLPAAGARADDNGMLNDRGNSGFYWNNSVQEAGTTVGCMYFFNNSQNTYYATRGGGFSVRCVAD